MGCTGIGLAHAEPRLRRRDTIRSPWDGAVAGEVELADAADLELAIATAAAAFAETRIAPTHRRVELLDRASRLVGERREALAALVTAETGKPIRFSRAEVDRAALTFRFAGEVLHGPSGEVWPLDVEPRAEGRRGIVARFPRGPVAAFSPFNFPINLSAHKIAPAIAAGCPVVLKPPPQAPLSVLALRDLLLEAGLPPTWLSVLPMDPDVAQRLAGEPRLRVLSFTGSAAVGWKLRSLAGQQHVLLELGGNAPVIVDETANLDGLAAQLAVSAFAAAGQVCIKAQRLFVHRSRFERFADELVSASQGLACGDPADPATTVGPLISLDQVRRIAAWVDEAFSRGARVRCGGKADGPIYRPTILTGVPPESQVCREEVFGPVAILEPFDEFSAALAAANASRYGLQAAVFTRDLARATTAFRELEFGAVLINELPSFRVDHMPYGGSKASGLGREGARAAYEELTEPRLWVIAD